MTDTTTDTAYDAALAYARDRGRQDGESAAGWYVQDTIGGRVSGDPRKAAEYIIRGIEDGDPAVTDGFPFALLAAGLGDQEETDSSLPGWFSEICDAYESAFDTAAEDAIASAARAILS